MSRIIPKNRDPRINEFGPNDLTLNTLTGDLFRKANNELFKNRRMFTTYKNYLTK